MKSKFLLNLVLLISAGHFLFAAAPAGIKAGPAPGGITFTKTFNGSLAFGAIPAQTYGAADFDPGATSTTDITYTSSNTAVATIVSGKIHIVGAGSSTITANDGSQSLKQPLTVIKAKLTIAVDKKTKAYGADVPALTVTYTGFVNGDTQASLISQPALSTAAATSSPAGSYPIKISGAASANYAITSSGASLTITKVPLTITADNKTKVHGTANPALTITYTGFVNDETFANLATQPVITTTATTASGEGDYPITVSGAASPNYTLSYVSGLLLITNGINAPVISYTTPRTFKEGASVHVGPTNTGGAIPSQIANSAITTFAGTGGIKGAANGAGTAASFNTGAGGVAVGAQFIYVADELNNVIRKIDLTGVVTTFAGSGQAGAVNATGTDASFNHPTGIVVDRTGNVYVADAGNNLIRKITPDGTVTTYAGTGVAGAGDGASAAATFNSPKGLAIAASGNLYTLDTKNSAIRRISTAGLVSTIATNAVLANAVGISVDQTNNTFIVTATDNYIRRVSLAGGMAVIAGTGVAGSTNGSWQTSSFNNPQGVTVFADGSILVVDGGNNKIRIMRTDGTVTNYMGNGTKALANGDFSTASFNGPVGIGSHDFNSFYITDAGSYIIRKAGTTGYSLLSGNMQAGLSFNLLTGVFSGTPTAVQAATNYTVLAYNAGGTAFTSLSIAITNPANAGTSPKIYTIAGNGTSGFSGDGGAATQAELSSPYAMARDKKGNIYIATNDNRIRKVDAVTKQISTIAGTGVAGYSGDSGPAVNAQINIVDGLPGLAVDAAGNVYLGDGSNNRVRKINAATHIISTIAGTGVAGNSGDGGPPVACQLNHPGGIVVDANNNVYISDTYNSSIRKIDITTHKISTIVSGLAFVERMALDKNGNLYWADEGAYTVSKLDAATHNVTVIAGTGQSSYSGDGGPATAATFESPMGITTDSLNNVYVVDQPASVIRKIDAETNIISTFAGNGVRGYTGDGGAATLAEINYSTDLVIDASGIFYLNDYANNVVRRIGGTASAQTITFAAIPAIKYGTALVVQPATSSSGLPVTYTSTEQSVADYVNGVFTYFKVGGTTFIASQAGNANFLPAASVSRGLTIQFVPLTITADDQTKVAGDPNPKFTVTYSGFVNGETEAVVIRQPNITTTAKVSSPAGTYPITPSAASVPNYAVKYVAGTLTITAKPGINEPTVVAANNGQAGNPAIVMQPSVKQAMSPNGDGINDVLMIDGITKFPENKLIVMSSTGTKVFEMSGYNNVNKAFDGHSNITGALQKAGTYFYKLQYKEKGLLKQKTGYFIIRH